MKKNTEKQSVETAIKKIYRATLDINGVYFGKEQVAELMPDDVEVPEDCDLPIGKYKWFADTAQFIPLPKSQHSATPNAPLADRALYELIKSINSPPAYCVEWCLWFEKSIDGGAK